MSFVGKKYKFVSSENIDEFCEAAKAASHRARVLKDETSAFKITRIDDQNYSLTSFNEGNTNEFKFKLGEDHVVNRGDGSQLQITNSLEGNNVFNQTFKDEKDKQIHFKRVFEGNRCVQTLSTPGVDVQGKIYYEVVTE